MVRPEFKVFQLYTSIQEDYNSNKTIGYYRGDILGIINVESRSNISDNGNIFVASMNVFQTNQEIDNQNIVVDEFGIQYQILNLITKGDYNFCYEVIICQ